MNRLTGERVVIPFLCGSWRCEGCKRARGAQDFARIQAALQAHPLEHVVFLVLTFPRKGTVRDGYQALADAWPKLRKRLQRIYGRIEYAAVVEQHRDGWPHMNLILVNAELGAACQGEGWRKVRRDTWKHLKACGFGVHRDLSPARSKEALAGYMVKLAGHFDSVVGEATKLSQLPMQAPPNFRRLRSSRGFLPPVTKNEEWTGWVVDKATALPLKPLNDVQQAALALSVTVDSSDTPAPVISSSPPSAVTPRAMLLLGAAAVQLDRPRVDVGRQLAANVTPRGDVVDRATRRREV